MDTFYEENQENNIKMLKNKMTLDFNAPASHNKKAKHFKTCILESPDLKMLKFSSPELERMIIQQNGLITTTPTPSAALPYFLKQEQEATEEQEQFSRGFEDALYLLHQTNGQQQQQQQQPSHPSNCLSNNNNSNNSNNNQNSNTNNNQNNSHSNSNTNSNRNQINSMNNTSSDSSSDLTIADNSQNSNNNRRNSYHMLVPSTVATTVSMQTNTSSAAKFAVPQAPSSHPTTTASTAATVSQTEQYVSVSSCQTNGAHVLINQSVNNHNHSSVLPPYSQAVNNHNNSIYPMSIKIEPQQHQKVNYPSMKELSPPAQTSLTQPIDMEDQERIKLERKRQRNRIAASKCRRRKLERISKLEDKVKGLKGENSELSIVVNKLRDQVCSLKQQVMEHVKCGCQLMAQQ